MKSPFALPDPEYDRRLLKKEFVDRFLCGDDFALDDDEIAAREAMFDKLAELADVITEVKKKIRKKKSG